MYVRCMVHHRAVTPVARFSLMPSWVAGCIVGSLGREGAALKFCPMYYVPVVSACATARSHLNLGRRLVRTEHVALYLLPSQVPDPEP